MTKLRIIAVVLALLGQAGLDAQTPPPLRLQITILDGEGALNNIKQQTAREPIVQVEDENHKPIAGALVIFTLPQSGPGGTFSGGSTVFDGVTDVSGQAKPTGLVPNNVVGKYQIQVDVRYRNLNAHTAINQSNFMGATTTAAAHAATHAFPLKAVLIVAAAGGAAAAAAVIATQSSNSPSAAVLTPGTPTVGPPPAVSRH
jgi:hypothetical protein